MNRKLWPDRTGQKPPSIIYGPNFVPVSCRVCGWMFNSWENCTTYPDGSMEHAKHTDQPPGSAVPTENHAKD